MLSKNVIWILAIIVAIAVLTTVILVFVLRDNSRDETFLVETKLGKIVGSSFTTRLDKKFMGFRGIRYAEPPVDELRFQPPVPVKPWSGVFDATVDGPSCPQPNDLEVSEDCLRLNVYTSEIPNDESQNLKPVLVWIHSGAFIIGSSASTSAGGEYLLDRDVVLVTVTNRLGSLGFLSTGTKEAPGNNGFKDQVTALRWVRENIDKFGGDPNSVTLMGQGSGARSAVLHLVSPMSQNLFHRVILMSGSVTGQWKVPTDQLELAKKQAKMFNCTNDNVKEMIDCLREIDGVAIGKTSNDFKEFDGKPTLIWYPVIEPDFGQERFLTDDPSKLFANGNFKRVPIIAGMTDNEFARSVPSIVDKAENLKLMNEQFEKYAPICFMYERETEKSRDISRVLWASYVKTQALTKSSFDGLAQLFSDASTGFAVHRFVQLVHEFTPVYYYLNTFVGRHSYFYYPEETQTPYGISHADDVIYLLKHKFPMITATDPEAHHLEQIPDMWVSFTTTGNPNNKSNSHIADLDWTTYQKSKENYLDIGDELLMKTRLYSERFDVWDSLFAMD